MHGLFKVTEAGNIASRYLINLIGNIQADESGINRLRRLATRASRSSEYNLGWYSAKVVHLYR